MVKRLYIFGSAVSVLIGGVPSCCLFNLFGKLAPDNNHSYQKGFHCHQGYLTWDNSVMKDLKRMKEVHSAVFSVICGKF